MIQDSFTIPPAAITDTTIALLWDKLEVASKYVIYQDGNKIDTTTVTDYTVKNLETGRTYEFFIESYGENGNLLTKSREIKATTKNTGKIYNIEEFGAIGDGKTLNTKAIQAAIDNCEIDGTVYVPRGTFITGALFLKSHMTLFLEKDSKLLGSLELSQYPVIEGRFEGTECGCYASLINIGSMSREETTDVTIQGEGTIDANGNELMRLELEDNKGKRGSTICAIRTKDLYLKDITVRQSPAWCVHFIYCEGVSVNGVGVHTKFDEDGNRYFNVYNGDGIDPDSSKDVYIFNSMIDSQDDCIAIKSGRDVGGRRVGISTENIRITNCVFKNGFGVAVGSEMSAGVRNVLVEDCTFHNTFSVGTVKAPRGRGGVIEDIVYRNCTLKSDSLEHHDCRWFRGALLIDQFYSHEEYDEDKKEKVTEGTPMIRNIIFENITVDTLVTTVIYLVGLPENPLKNITMKNISGSGKHTIKVRNVESLSLTEINLVETKESRK